MEYHQIANIFPMMNQADFDALKADIAANGLLEAVWLHPDGRIIDGRNRYRACCELGIEPDFRTYAGSLETPALVNFVVSLNLKRRHLDSGQKAFVALEVERVLSEAARERQGQRTDLDPTLLKDFSNVDRNERTAASQAAAIVGTNAHYVTDAKRIKQDSPELVDDILSGRVTLVQAKRQVKESHREARRQENAVKAEAAPDLKQAGVRFATILLDPPWDWGDEDEGVGGGQFGRAKPTYATVPIDKMHALPVPDLADKDCHIYMWITNRSLPKGFALLESWGFRYITCITWVKPSFGMGNYFRGQTEHILFGVKGSQELKRRDVGTVFHAARGPNGHSSKPEMVYDLIESCSPGPYLEMFARQSRSGWYSWGAEINDA